MRMRPVLSATLLFALTALTLILLRLLRPAMSPLRGRCMSAGRPGFRT